MSGEIEYCRVPIKSILGSVAVMHVKVGDEDAVEIMFFHGLPCRDSNVVEQAESHSSCSRGVVTWWPDQGEGTVHFPLHDCLCGFEEAASSIKGYVIGSW